MSADNEEGLEEVSIYDRYETLENQLPDAPETNVGALNEALYTYSETHDFSIDADLAMLMWQIVEWSKTATEDQVEEVRL